MGEKKATKMSFSTALLIIAIIIIIVMGGIIYKISIDKKAETKRAEELQIKTNELNAQVNSLNGTIDEVKKATSNISTNTITKENSTSNTNITNSSNNEKHSSSIEIGFDEMIVVLEGKPYVIPIHRPNWNNAEEGLEPRGVYYYNKFEIDNIKSGVKGAYAESLGTDPSTSIYFVMEDGSVRILESSGSIPNVKYTSKEILSSNNRIVELKMEGNKLNAITKDGKKIEIAEAKA